jgi:protein-tyrosine phosphatase
VTSGPSSVWPKKAYRNPLDQLVAFLDKKHGEDWSIFEFRAEGTGYPDSEVYNRIHHFPWPDHHPPPFAIVPNLMAAMRNWIQRLDEPEAAETKKKRVAVVHCKAGKGRSGTTACSYLISEEGWDRHEALQRFTARRMRTGFGNGVSIPSQLRWVGYVDRWTNKMSKKYIERPVEILEVHVDGLRDGVKVAIEGYEDNGRRIQNFHIFNREEKTVVEDGNAPESTTYRTTKLDAKKDTLSSPVENTPQSSTHALSAATAANTQAVILRPMKSVILPTSDINIDFERRNQASMGMSLVTSIAHVWFNAFFEGGYEGNDSGVFEIEWEAMDGIKGSIRKGSKAIDRLKVVWRYAKSDGLALEKTITQPQRGEPVPEGEPADWKGENPNPEDEKGAKHSDGVTSGRPGGAMLTMGAMVNAGASSLTKELGLREQSPESHGVSRAQSPGPEALTTRRSAEIERAEKEQTDDEDEGVKPHYGNDEYEQQDQGFEGRNDTKVGHGMEVSIGKVAHIVSKMKGTDQHGGEDGSR